MKKLRDARRAGDRLNPVRPLPFGTRASNVYGASSIQQFHNAPALYHTHADAQGWLDYLAQFYSYNFWFQDGQVQPWEYYEPYDHYLDTYGIDAVLTAYHSGHGGMNDEGVFYAPLGNPWNDEPATVYSDRMSLGDQLANYIFWSTCYSLVVTGGDDPVRTWGAANRGFRMLFGYDTPSVDDPNYGKFFWEEWAKGKSFSYAFLDASWRISQYQSPAVVAVGGDEQEADDRFENERYLYWENVPTDYWVWGWYAVDEIADLSSAALPVAGLIGSLAPPRSAEESRKAVLDLYGLKQREPSLAGLNGLMSMQEEDFSLAIEPGGGYELFLYGKDTGKEAQRIRKEDALNAAKSFIAEHGLEYKSQLKPVRQRRLHKAGAPADLNSRALPGGTAVVFTQTIGDVPAVSTDAGQLTVTVDDGGRVKGVRDTRRDIAELHRRYRRTPAAPRTKKNNEDPALLLERACRDEAERRWGGQGRELPELHTVPGSTAAGYIFEGDEAYLGAVCEVEAEFSSGLRTRFRVTAPLYR